MLSSGGMIHGARRVIPGCKTRLLSLQPSKLRRHRSLTGSHGNTTPGARHSSTAETHRNIAQDAEAQRVEALISSLPLVRHLRRMRPTATADHETNAAPIYRESRMHGTMHPTAFATHLVTGSMEGRDKLPVDPHVFIQTQPKYSAVAVLYIGSKLCGHPGYVHGGVPFALFDDLFARCAGLVFKSGVGVTANLNMDFRKPSVPDRVYVMRAEIERYEGRKIWLKGSMRCLPLFAAEDMTMRGVHIGDGGLSLEEEAADLVAEASALFIEPKFAGSMVSLFQNG